MSLRRILCCWLRGLRATAVNLDEALTQRRELARQDAAWEADAARFEAEIADARAKLARLAPPSPPAPLGLEALMLLPTVVPDRSGYWRPPVASAELAAIWLREYHPEAWWNADVWNVVVPVAERLLERRAVVGEGRVAP